MKKSSQYHCKVMQNYDASKGASLLGHRDGQVKIAMSVDGLRSFPISACGWVMGKLEADLNGFRGAEGSAWVLETRL